MVKLEMMIATARPLKKREWVKQFTQAPSGGRAKYLSER